MHDGLNQLIIGAILELKAAAHAHGSRTWVSLRFLPHELWLEVGDDGQGFDVRGRLSSGDGHPGIMGRYERAEMGYRPNRVAANLRRQRTSTLGVLIPTLSNPFFSKLLEALETAGSARGYSLIFGDTNHDPVLDSHYVDLFLDHRCDGIIVLAFKYAFQVSNVGLGAAVSVIAMLGMRVLGLVLLRLMPSNEEASL